MTRTVSLQRSWEIHLKTYEAFGLNEEQMQTFYGYLIFIFGVWLIGWILLTSLAFYRLSKLRKEVKIKYPNNKELLHHFKLWYKHKYLRWYWNTRFNWFCIALLIAIGTICFGNWYGA